MDAIYNYLKIFHKEEELDSVCHGLQEELVQWLEGN